MPRDITTQACFICVVQKWGILLANWHGRLVNFLPVGKLRVIVEFAPIKGLTIFGIIGLRQMNRTCDFWAVIQWMYFKRIQQWGLITLPQVRILLFFEAWWLRKNVTSRFHLYPLKNVSLISGKGNIRLLLICILQAWKWAFKWNFWFSINGEPLCFANYNAICPRRWERTWHVFGHVWMNLRGGSRFANEKKLFEATCYWPIA